HDRRGARLAAHCFGSGTETGRFPALLPQGPAGTKQSAAGPEPSPGQLAVAARRSEPASGTRKRRSIMARIAARAASGRTVPALAALAAASAFLAGAGMAAAGDYRH